MSHPIEQFQPPGSIQAGQALKDLLDEHLLHLIAASVHEVYQDFPTQQFLAAASDQLADLELTPRAQHIARALIAASAGIASGGSGDIATESRPANCLDRCDWHAAVFTYRIHTSWRCWGRRMCRRHYRPVTN